MFLLQGAVDVSVLGAEGDATQMPRQTDDAAQWATRQIRFQQQGSERIIDKAPFRIHGNALNVAFRDIGAGNPIREIVEIHKTFLQSPSETIIPHSCRFFNRLNIRKETCFSAGLFVMT